MRTSRLNPFARRSEADATETAERPSLFRRLVRTRRERAVAAPVPTDRLSVTEARPEAAASTPSAAGDFLATSTSSQWKNLVFAAAETYEKPGFRRFAYQQAMNAALPAVAQALRARPRLTRARALSRNDVTGYVAPPDIPFRAAFADGFAEGMVRRAAREADMTPREYLTPGIGRFAAVPTAVGLLPRALRARAELSAGGDPHLVTSDLTELVRRGSYTPPVAEASVPAPTASRFRFGRARTPCTAVRERELRKRFSASHDAALDALALRDAYHVRAAGQIVTSALGSLWKRRAEIGFPPDSGVAREVGADVGAALDPGLLARSLVEQRKLERTYTVFRQTKSELSSLHEETRAATTRDFEDGRAMVVVEGERFYDPYEDERALHDDPLLVRMDAAMQATLPDHVLRVGGIEDDRIGFFPQTYVDGALRLLTGLRNAEGLPEVAPTRTPARGIFRSRSADSPQPSTL